MAFLVVLSFMMFPPLSFPVQPSGPGGVGYYNVFPCYEYILTQIMVNVKGFSQIF